MESKKTPRILAYNYIAKCLTEAFECINKVGWTILASCMETTRYEQCCGDALCNFLNIYTGRFVWHRVWALIRVWTPGHSFKLILGRFEIWIIFSLQNNWQIYCQSGNSRGGNCILLPHAGYVYAHDQPDRHSFGVSVAPAGQSSPVHHVDIRSDRRICNGVYFSDNGPVGVRSDTRDRAGRLRYDLRFTVEQLNWTDVCRNALRLLFTDVDGLYPGHSINPAYSVFHISVDFRIQIQK